MSDDPRVQDLLSRSADRVRADPDAALEHVVEGARRRTQAHRVRVGVAALVVLVLVGLGFARLHDRLLGAGPVPPSGQPTRTGGPSSALPLGSGGTPLNGEWQTHPAEVSLVRTELHRAGVPGSVIHKVLAGADRWVVQLTFSTGLSVETWDPDRPSASLQVNDAYGWRPLAHQRLEISAAGGARVAVLTYQLAGDRLRLRVERAPRGRALAAARFRAWTLRPLRLVR